MQSLSTETTPLTSQNAPGPSYVFPGVSPRSRRRQLRQFQCCMCTIFVAILIIALLGALYYVDNPITNDEDEENDNATDTSPISPFNATTYLIVLDTPLKDERETIWALPSITKGDIDEAEAFGVKALGDKELFEEANAGIPTDTPSFRHFRSTTTSPEARKLSRRGYVEYHATIHIANKLKYNKTMGRTNIGKGPALPEINVGPNFTCDFNAKHRTENGMCNNKLNPRQGSSLRPFRRAVLPDYGDGIANPRLSSTGKALPSARQVSLQMHRPKYRSDLNFTVMLAVFGQFLDHDITATAISSAQDGEPINCCTVPLNAHPECFPVAIVPGDPYNDLYNTTCLNFVRSAPAPTGCLGPRQQLNQATAYIDASTVYGTSAYRQKLLRTKKDGALRMFVTPDNRELLPLSTNPEDGCNREEMNARGKYCFESGDDRANENLLLTSMHLLFARNHNYLARGLRETRPDWGDETVFQEARKILGAQMQHIAYNEFLPILLGDDGAAATGIKPTPSSLSDSYDSRVNAEIANNFAGAVFRFAHTLLPDLFKMTRDNSTPKSIELHQMLFNPYSLWESRGLDKAIGSAVNTPVPKVSRFVSKELTQKLFEGTAEDKVPHCGLDLVSLNIQRGRDHGLPSYSVFRKHCRLSPADTWEQMALAVDTDSLESMKMIYESPLDVDLYTGALSEPPLNNAIFGPLLSCLVSDQFIRLKRGDSFWYERTTGPQRFSKLQRNAIYETTLAGIICQNADSVRRTQKYVMQGRDKLLNPYVDCEEIEHFDFKPWASGASERKTWSVPVSNAQSLVTVLNGSSANVTLPAKPLM